MCNRYVTPDQSAIEREWSRVAPLWTYSPSDDVYPNAPVPIVRAMEGRLDGPTLRWGLVPRHHKGDTPAYGPLNNARDDQLEKRLAWKEPWAEGRRCIFPALGWYEWQHQPDKKTHRYFLTIADRAIAGYAGFWERSESDDRTRVIESCTMITVAANELVRGIHNKTPGNERMPVILHRQDYEQWLFGTVAEATRLLVPYPDAQMIAYRVRNKRLAPNVRLTEPLSGSVL
jgi:putative SOS response-associated peptidase YedK